MNNFLHNVYEKMSIQKNRYGMYHKTLFHLHTPASFDYRLLKKWKDSIKYKNANEEELVQVCIKRKVLPEEKYFANPIIKNDIFSSKKEWLSYILLANELLCNDYEFVVVADHNTIKGIAKLQTTVKERKN